MKRQIVFRTGAVLLSVAVVGIAVGVGEWVARCVADAPENVTLFDDRNLRIRGRDFVERDPELGFRLRAGFESEKLRIDESGFRRGLASATLGATTILVMGDSTTFGWGVGDEDSYPARLESSLNEATRGNSFRVINAGVPSYTSAQVHLYLRRLLQQLKPDIVIVSVLWNDIWFSLVRNWYPEILVFAQPAPWRGFFVQHSALYRWLTAPASDGKMGRDVPNARARDHYLATIVRIVDDGLAGGARVVLLAPPLSDDRIPPEGFDPMQQNTISKHQLVERASGWAAEAADAARAHGAIVVDHSLAAGRSPDGALFSDFVHPNAEGYALLVADLAPQLRAMMPEFFAPKGTVDN